MASSINLPTPDDTLHVEEQSSIAKRDLGWKLARAMLFDHMSNNTILVNRIHEDLDAITTYPTIMDTVILTADSGYAPFKGCFDVQSLKTPNLTNSTNSITRKEEVGTLPLVAQHLLFDTRIKGILPMLDERGLWYKMTFEEFHSHSFLVLARAFVIAGSDLLWKYVFLRLASVQIQCRDGLEMRLELHEP
ncbi:uncharacterized protein PGRI_003150 [Penicillium griseofulvum]|uniref:Uncharacterized protein n=1 Tax=Penicillium patulum TaxID=5078 RepID=A0A135LWE3_PENPA|nr:uncharacterized protein PGRI_003150 [Penicillium griseofulvum]KXG53265.1 hypothetical protein PGRI_003150 [Penicillium griseofulvum]